MHSYQIDERVRINIFIISAILATAAAWVLYIILNKIPFKVPWWIDLPSVLGLFGLFVGLFDQYWWKSRLVQNFPSIAIPNINGIWKVTINSSYSNFSSPIQAKAVIRQTAFNISISVESDYSCSHSVTAALLCTNRLNVFELIYFYINEPAPDSTRTMSIHHGTTRLKLSEDGNNLEGRYYSDRGRQNYGSIIFVRV